VPAFHFEWMNALGMKRFFVLSSFAMAGAFVAVVNVMFHIFKGQATTLLKIAAKDIFLQQ
jgi:hypothetical protein